MRMYNPEWEAIKDFEHAAALADVQFELSAGEIPADHGVGLFEQLVKYLPWLREATGAGVHPVHGAPTGRNDNLVINRRVKLTLRLPLDRLADAEALMTGARLMPHWRLGGGAGINLARFLDAPAPIDPVEWAHGAGALPWAEPGPRVTPESWQAFARLVRGDTLMFVLFLN